MTREAMNCETLSDALSGENLAELPPESRAAAELHLSNCATCRQTLEAIEGIKTISAPRPRFIPTDLAPVSPMPSRMVFVGLACVLPLLVAAVSAWSKGLDGWQELGPASRVLFGGLTALALAALVSTLYLQFKPGAGESIDGRKAVAATLAGFAIFALSLGAGWHPDAGGGAETAWICFRFGSIIAAGATLGLFALARRGFAANPNSASFWIGSLASLSGVIALTLHCPVQELSHLLLGHATVIAASGCLLALAVRQGLVRR